MSNPSLKIRACYQLLDEATIVDFLYAQKEELLLPDKAAAATVVQTLFDKGGVWGGYDAEGEMQAMLGFFFGEPSKQFRNKETVFIYVTALSPTMRLTRF